MRKKVLLTVIFIVMVFGVAFLGEIKNQRDLILEGGQTGRKKKLKKIMQRTILPQRETMKSTIR